MDNNTASQVVNGRKVIILKNQIDKSFTIMAQQAKIGGAILPSGFKVPDGDWTIIGHCLVENYTSNDDYQVYLSISEGVPE
tara:strand:- start:128 stop:370 length:243 start_codon:yes stop_codon:yes gene_type:complete